MTKLIIVCSPDLDADAALEYSRKHDWFLAEKHPHPTYQQFPSHAMMDGKLNFYFFPEADLGYASYRDHVSAMLAEAVEKQMQVVLIHTRYLEPAINGFIEVAGEPSPFTKKQFPKLVKHDQVEVHLFRSEEGWTIHHLTEKLTLRYDDEEKWPIGHFH